MITVTAIILTYNEAAHIVDCLDSVRFADHVIVFDSFSSDETVPLARAAGAEVIQRKFDHYAGQRNAALQGVAGRADWVLFVDADERVTPELAAEVRQVIERPGYAGWRIPRFNYIFGKLTRGAGWYPDYQTRLLKVGAAQYDPERQVHELVILAEAEGTMQQPLIHYNYRDVAQFISKQQRYSAYDARILREQGIQPKPQNYILQPWRQFWWRFVTLKGYQDGWHGLRLSLFLAWYEFRKYQQLRALWRNS
ncbi:MAG TPA: glycosyltransferase family 2 protein [Phototrophicaceae bacterium]|nr:glycosyltransferase family 2 protein [Phototrophicaceae bacterium]